jgi:hypothetical protein
VEIWALLLNLRPSSSSVGSPGPGILFFLLLPVVIIVGLMWLSSGALAAGVELLPPPPPQAPGTLSFDYQGRLLGQLESPEEQGD